MFEEVPESSYHATEWPGCGEDADRSVRYPSADDRIACVSVVNAMLLNFFRK